MPKPEKVPSMASLTDKVDDLFAAWDKLDSPGCAIGIVHDGKLIYGRGYGMANLDHAVPLSTKSVFYISSDSKQFVAMGAVLLARQGKLTLDDEIQRYIPEIRYYDDSITIRHLIHHTSGLRDYLTVGNLAGFNFDNAYPAAEVLRLITRQKQLNFRPGRSICTATRVTCYWRKLSVGFQASACVPLPNKIFSLLLE